MLLVFPMHKIKIMLYIFFQIGIVDTLGGNELIFFYIGKDVRDE